MALYGAFLAVMADCRSHQLSKIMGDIIQFKPSPKVKTLTIDMTLAFRMIEWLKTQPETAKLSQRQVAEAAARLGIIMTNVLADD